MSRKKFKFILGLCYLFVLLASSYIIAYFVSADASQNKFTIGKVGIILEEPNWDNVNAESIVPNEIIPKDPVVTNTESVDVLVGVSVTGIMDLIENNFIIGLVDKEGYGLQNGKDEVFCWDSSFTLVNRDGISVSSGEDHALTLAELNDICKEYDNKESVKLYFAYNNVLVSGDKTTPLFSGVQNKNLNNKEPLVSVVMFFTKDGGSTPYVPVSEYNFTDGAPATDVHGNYIYKYKIKVDGTFLEDVYDTYENAALKAESLIIERMDCFNLMVQAAAIQAENDSIGAEWTNPARWYKILPETF